MKSIDIVVPYGDDGHSVPRTPQLQIEDVQQKVSIVVLAEAIIHPWTVVVHLEHTPVTHHAVRCPSGFQIFAAGTLTRPHLFEIINCLVSVFEH